MRLIRQNATAWLVMAGGLCLGGCTARVGGDGRSLAQHNDELRRDNLELRQQIETIREQLALLESELRAVRDESSAQNAIPGVVTPVFAGVELGRYSGPVDTDGDGLDDELRLYVKPTDQQGRTLVVPGRATVRLLRIEGESPEVLAAQSWEPADWDGAYRSGFTGDHYSLAMPLPADQLADLDTLTVTVDITEATRGTVRGARAIFPLHR